MCFPGSNGKESACNVGDLEKGMATYSRLLVWRIPRTEKPDGLQSMGLERFGYD